MDRENRKKAGEKGSEYILRIDHDTSCLGDNC